MAPAELREHVRRIAAGSAPLPRRRRPTRRHALVVAVPLAAALAGAALLLPRGSGPGPDTRLSSQAAPAPVEKAVTGAATTPFSAATAPADAATVPAANPNRVQRITATLELRVPSTQAVSDNTKQAVSIARSLGGYPNSLTVDAQGRTGYASLVLRIPKQNVQRAVTRLSALGTIVGENVSIQDIQAQVDATARKIARLEARLSYWQGQPQTTDTQKHVSALTSQIAKLRRGREGTIQAASYATVSVQMTTRPAPAAVQHGHGPLHGLVVAFRWIGIAAVYVIALGAPLLLLAGLGWLAARAVRRHRENELLARP
jgi:hypothetical protein